MNPAGALLTDVPSSAVRVLRRFVATQWWLAAAVLLVVASGCAARLGYVANQLAWQNSSGWGSAVVLASIPLLAALHISCVRSAAGAGDEPSSLWEATRARWWAYVRLGVVALVFTTPLAVALALLGNALWGESSLAQAALPIIAGLMTFAPSVLVTDPNRSVAAAIATSAAWVFRSNARLIVAASVVVACSEIALVHAGPDLGWSEVTLRVLLASAVVAMAAITASYTVAHIHSNDLSLLRRDVVPAGRDLRPLMAAVAIAAAAVYVVVGAQPLLLARTAGGGGAGQFTISFASVQNADGIPLTLTASADSVPGATLHAVGFTSSNQPLFNGLLPDTDLTSTITLGPGQQAKVVAEWTPVRCTSSTVLLHLWVTSRVGRLTERHALPSATVPSGNCP